MKHLLLTCLLLCCAMPALAMINPDEPLADAALEARARDISKDVRCPVCESQNIENSNAEVARDLRLFIRERLAAGDTDAQIMTALRNRYGDSIFLNPPLADNTLLLWFGPGMVLMGGGLFVFAFIRKSLA